MVVDESLQQRAGIKMGWLGSHGVPQTPPQYGDPQAVRDLTSTLLILEERGLCAH